MTEKLANKPNSSPKPKTRPRRAHSRRNLQGALTSSTCKRANATARRLATRGARAGDG